MVANSALLRVALCLVIGFAYVQRTDAALAAMSIDLGSQFIKIGLVKPGVPMEIVLNKESRRKTPNIISIRNGERLFAEAAAALASKYPKSAYQYILSLLAKQSGDAKVEQYKQQFPFAAITIDEVRNTVTFPVESETYNVETLLAMILWSVKQTTEAYAGQTVKDVVITVPIFFNQAERRAIATAADLAGLNLLQLLNDGSAAALNYGVFRRKEITETPQTMLIYDMGATKTTATLVEYVLEAEKNSKDKNPVVRTIGVGFDRNLGGLEISLKLAKHLEKIFRTTVKTPTDIATNARSMAKLLKEAERVKQVLSANKDTYAQVENLHEEQNFRAKVTRDELEAMIVDMEPKFSQPITEALAMAEKTIEQIDQFVLMGAGTRMPKVQEVLKTVIGEKEIGRFLNTDEAIALGAVYQAAHLSKSFKVLPFAVQELVLYPVQVNFKTKSEEGELKDATRTIFGYKTHYPTSKKIVNFQSYQSDFEIALNYGSTAHLKADQIAELGATQLSNVSIKGVEDAILKEVIDDHSEMKGIKASFSIDLSGIIEVSKAEVVVDRRPKEDELTEYAEKQKAYEEYEAAEKKDKEEKKKIEAEKKKAEAEKKKKEKEAKKDKDSKDKTEEKTETEEPVEEEKKEEKPEEKKRERVLKPIEPKVVSVKVPLTVEVAVLDLIDMTTEAKQAAKNVLVTFEKVEKEKHDHEAAMNALEATVYDLPIKIEDGEEFAEYLTTEEKEKISVEAKRLRLWLEDDVTFETKTEEFIANKKSLDELSAPGYARKKEHLQRPKAIEALEQMFNHSRVFYTTAKNLTTSEDPVFTETEIQILEKLIQTTDEWWAEKGALLAKQPKNEDPLISTQEIAEKIRDLDREVKYLLNKLKSFVPKKKVEKKAKKVKTGESEKVKDDENMFDSLKDVDWNEEKEANDDEPTTTETPEETTTEKAEKEHDASEL